MTRWCVHLQDLFSSWWCVLRVRNDAGLGGVSTYRICSVLGGVYLGSGMMHDQVVYPLTGLVQIGLGWYNILEVRNGTSEYDVSTTYFMPEVLILYVL